MEKFNQGTPRVADVDYYTIAGDRWIGPFSSPLVPRPNDGLVPVASVRLAYATHLDTSHLSHIALLKSFHVYDTVKGKVDPPYSEEPNSLAYIVIEDGDILAGQHVSQSVVANDVNEVAFILLSGSPLGFTLESPSGDYITDQAPDTDVSYESAEWLDLLAQGYVVQQPASGVWKAHVGTDADPDHFMLVVSAENTFVLDGSTDGYSNPGGKEMRIRATLDVDATIAEMEVQITDPNGSREIVALHDDGLHEDDLSADGVYGNSYIPLLEGEHILVFSSEGIAGGKEFSRADLESVLVEAPTAEEQ